MEQQGKLSHFDQHGNAIMVDVSDKDITSRIAIAEGVIEVNQAVMKAIVDQSSKKGDVLGVARVAGIMGAKKTSELIPLCHPLFLNKCTIDFEVKAEELKIVVRSTVKTNGKTGVEMEALTGASVALLTIYDMCKAIDKGMKISAVRLLEKDGGKSGRYVVEE